MIFYVQNEHCQSDIFINLYFIHDQLLLNATFVTTVNYHKSEASAEWNL